MNLFFDVIFKKDAITGITKDNFDKPVEYATVTLFKALDSTIVCGKITDKNGELNIKTSYSRGRRLSAAGMRTQLHVPIQVEIIDNGPGILPDIRDHIFDPFVADVNRSRWPQEIWQH